MYLLKIKTLFAKKSKPFFFVSACEYLNFHLKTRCKAGIIVAFDLFFCPSKHKNFNYFILRSLVFEVCHFVEGFLNMKPCSKAFFIKNGPTLASFSLFFGLFKQTSLQIAQQINVKNVMHIQYMAPGFKPTTFRT